MLPFKYLNSNNEHKKLALKYWTDEDFSDDEQSAEEFRVSDNIVYPFSINGRSYNLRLTPVEETTLESLNAEMEFVEYLYENDFSVSLPLRDKEDNYIRTIQTDCGEFYAQVFQAPKGERFDKVGLNGRMMYAYGASLGKLHELSSGYKPKTRKRSYVGMLEWIIMELRYHDDATAAKEEVYKLKSEFEKLTRYTEDFGLINFNYAMDNVYYRKETFTNEDGEEEERDVFTAEGYDNAVYNWFVADTEECVSSINLLCPKKKVDGFVSRFYEGYLKFSPVDEDFMIYLPLMRRFINLYKYAKLKRVLRLSPVQRKCPDWQKNLRKVYQAKIILIEKTFSEINISE